MRCFVRLWISKTGGASPSPTEINGEFSYPCRGVHCTSANVRFLIYLADDRASSRNELESPLPGMRLRRIELVNQLGTSPIAFPSGGRWYPKDTG